MSLETGVQSPEFSSWRRYLWPVHRRELRKLIPMLLIFFFISFDYNVLRTLKDSLLITAKSSGAEVIPFVKVWAMFPGAVLMTLFFTWLSNRLSGERVFYIILSVFLGYFALFAFVLYPIRDTIHPHILADYFEELLPLGYRGLVAMFRYWTFTLFYVMSELWSSAILSVLFWGFANQVTKINEAKRFYGLFGVGANLSGIVAGQMSVLCCNFTRQGSVLPFGEDAWHQSLILMVSLILIAGIISLFLFRWLNQRVLRVEQDGWGNSSYATPNRDKSKQMSLKQSFSCLLNSKYLLCIAIVVVAYNCVINLTEVIWKHQVKELYPHPNDYTLYMNHIVSIIGVVATFTSLFVAGNAIRKLGWTFTALITPFVLLITSIGFFSFFFLKKISPELVVSFIGVTPLTIVVFFGSAQNILSRGAKYSVFDATKEMSFIPLSIEDKRTGKASIDGVCSRFGKSAGSVVHQGFLIIFSTLSASAPYVAVVLLGVIVIWAMAIRVLGKQFNELIETSVNTISTNDKPTTHRPIHILSEHGLLQEPQTV